jgi:hemolysin III
VNDEQVYGHRPRLRGMFHVWGAFAFAIAAPFLMQGITDPGAWWGVAAFYAGIVGQFAISGLYHRIEWTPRALGRMRRLDHAFIYVLIWCCFAPLCLTALPRAEGLPLLAVAGVGVLLGVARVLIWPYAPKPIATASYCLLPLLAAPYVTPIFAAAGATGTACLVAGNAIVALGAVVYAYDWPNPWPDTFGAHEIFHLTVVACGVFYSVPVLALARAAGT